MVSEASSSSDIPRGRESLVPGALPSPGKYEGPDSLLSEVSLEPLSRGPRPVYVEEQLEENISWRPTQCLVTSQRMVAVSPFGGIRDFLEELPHWVLCPFNHPFLPSLNTN